MSIEHNLIPAGEQHVVANWQVATVPDLDNLTVTFDDIGKQAWVQGIGHFTLANSDPITWEGASAGIDTISYNTATKVLTVTDTTGATFTATLDGLNTAEVAALITAHAGAADPHGDRAYSIQRANHTGTQLASTISDFAAAAAAAAPVTSVHGRTGAVVAQSGDYTAAQVGAQTADATLTALAALTSSSGILVQTAADTFTKRQLSATAGHGSWTNATGSSGDPTFSLASTGVSAGVYGSATLIPVITLDLQGRATLATTVAIGTSFTDSTFFIVDNGDATKKVTWQVSGIATGTTRTWTAPNADINFGDLSAVATTNNNVLSGTRNRIVGSSYTTVSGTDNSAIGCGDGTAPNAVTIAGVKVTAINCSGFSLPRTGDNDNTFVNCYGFSNPTGGGSNDLDYCGAINVRLSLPVGSPSVPDFSRQTLIGMGGSTFKSIITVTGSNTAAGNVDLALSSKKPIACTPYLLSRMCTHYIKLIGSDNDGTDLNSLTRIVTAEYKVTARVTGAGVSLGAVQTIVAPYADVGAPDTSPTVTISVTGSGYNSLLNINVGSSQATKWAAVVESHYTYI